MNLAQTESSFGSKHLIGESKRTSNSEVQNCPNQFVWCLNQKLVNHLPKYMIHDQNQQILGLPKQNQHLFLLHSIPARSLLSYCLEWLRNIKMIGDLVDSNTSFCCIQYSQMYQSYFQMQCLHQWCLRGRYLMMGIFLMKCISIVGFANNFHSCNGMIASKGWLVDNVVFGYITNSTMMSHSITSTTIHNIVLKIVSTTSYISIWINIVSTFCWGIIVPSLENYLSVQVPSSL